MIRRPLLAKKTGRGRPADSGICFPIETDFLSATAIAAAQAVIGIDPGIGGGIARVDRESNLIDAVEMPPRDGQPDARASMRRCSRSFWRDGTREMSVCFVAARPGEGSPPALQLLGSPP